MMLGPNIIGGFNTRCTTNGGALVTNGSGAFRTAPAGMTGYTVSNANETTQQRLDGVSFDASRSSSIYNSTGTVQPASLCFNYVIKA